MKAVGYVRVSTETQIREGQGIKVQKEQIEKYCNAYELELIGIYEDRGISGAMADEKNLTIDREGLQNMLVDIHDLGVKCVVVLNTSRLWRSDLVKILIQRELRKHDIDVKAVDQPTYSIYSQDNPSHFFVNGIMELLDQYQRLEIALRLKRGRAKKAQNGGFAGGQRALGYKHIIVDNKPDITIDKREAMTVSLINNLRKGGLSMKAIADYLNDKQVPTKRGGNWYASTVQYILNNKLYKGLFEYNSISTERLDLVIQ